MRKRLLRILAGIEAALEPESLYCDGERSAQEAENIRLRLLSHHRSVCEQLRRLDLAESFRPAPTQ
jgi:hypothetical protein